MEPVQPLSGDAYRGVDSLSTGRLLTDFVCYAVVTLAAAPAVLALLMWLTQPR